MKLHAIYTLTTAVLVSGLPNRVPQQVIVPSDLNVAVEMADDRAFDGFYGEPITLAWEYNGRESTIESASVPGNSALAEVVPSPSTAGNLDVVLEEAVTLADNSSAPSDDSGFAAFSQLGEAVQGAAVDSSAAPDQSEWDMAESLAASAAARADAMKNVPGGQTAATADSSDSGSLVPDLAASGFNEGLDSPPSSTMTIETVSPNQDQDQNQDLATQGAELETAVDQQQIVSDEEGFWIRGARLNDVFQYLARLGNFQYLHNSDLDAPNFVVTGHLRDGDPVLQMEELGLMYGITIYQKGSTVYAMTNAQLSQLPTKPFQYQLRYLRPTDIDNIKGILTTILTPGSGIVEYEPKTNTLIIIDNEQKVEGIREILADIDRPKLQISIETRILRINTRASNKIGVDWNSVLGEGLTIDAEESLNALFGLPDSDTVTEVVSLTKSLSTGDNTSYAGGSSFEITEGATLLNGLVSGDTAGSSTRSSSDSTAYDGFSNQGMEQSSSREENISITGSNLVLSPLQLSATLRALNAGGLAQQESSPTLITEDNEQAIISIIDRVPIIIGTVTETTAGQNISEEVRYRIDPDDPTLSEDPTKTREIGVSIAVTPTILPDNTIRMALRPRSAQITDYVVGRSGNSFPRVNESSVETIARIPNGSSLLIGGFYEEKESSHENKVPILGDIPVLRFFFSSSEKTKDHTSLIFVVTPKLYEPASSRETLMTTRAIQQETVIPGDHAWPDRAHPGAGYEPNLGWTLGNMVDAYEPIPPSNPLNPQHPVNLPEEDGYVGEQHPFAPQLDPAPQPKRKGLLNRLFNKDPQ